KNKLLNLLDKRAFVPFVDVLFKLESRVNDPSNEYIIRMGIKIILDLEHLHFNYLKKELSLSSIKVVARTQELKIFLCYEGLTLGFQQE
ncbi:MAG: hypothetical protein VYC17_01860, partial [Nitrospinota bacterium]|nr:hypothetical protein [Nitrospinota bacterium]